MLDRRSGFVIAAMAFAFAFLYIPIISVVVYSFNESRLVTVWSGFSLKWWRALPDNQDMISAALASLQVAVVSATVAVVLGTFAGVALARHRRFRGRTLFTGLITAPLVMPEVIMGISMLLLFVFLQQLIGWPERGFTTVAIAHITFTMAYVAVIVQSRLVTFDHALEEAAQDLGAPPAKVFFVITLPIIAPALVSGWLLSLTLSLDDLVITQFTTGPDYTTLPMVVYSSVRRGVSPEINVLASIIVGIVTVGIVVASLIMQGHARSRQRAARAIQAG
jgi:putrescine transport system permease protein